MKIEERDGVRVGQLVRDVHGKVLGKVTRLYDRGFEVARGFPILFRNVSVLRYDEVRGERDGAIVVARSDEDLLTLAGGELPPSWRVPAPPGFPTAAAPPEAHELLRALAAERQPVGPPAPLPPQAPAALAASRGEHAESEPDERTGADASRVYEETRGQSAASQHR
jgi:hypothetical protein